MKCVLVPKVRNMTVTIMMILIIIIIIIIIVIILSWLLHDGMCIILKPSHAHIVVRVPVTHAELISGIDIILCLICDVNLSVISLICQHVLE